MENASESKDALAAEISKEQAFIDGAYAVLERLRKSYRESQRKVEAQGAWGSPQARTERDAQAAHFGDQAMRLEQIQDRLVFGRIDMEDESSHYIGRAGLPDEDGGRLLVDWRAPASKPFYQATALNPFDVVRRRHISTSRRQVRGIEDDVLDASKAQARGLTFQGEGALMSALATARDGRMGDIVATIQAEQDQIIRAGNRGIVVVQGGPGTGKTAVALHRAAFLLYTHREILERRGVLIVGPSPIFLRYIEQVLPSLGETGVVSVPLGSLIPGITTQVTDLPEVAYVKGKIQWVETLGRAVRNLQRLPETDLHFSVGGRDATLKVSDVREARTRARRAGKPHNVARDGFALDLLDKVTRQLAGEDPDADTLDWWRESARGSKDVRREINLCWMPTTAETLLRRLYTRPEVLREAAVDLSDRDQMLVQRRKDAPFTVSDIPLLDELEELLGSSDLLAREAQARRERVEREELERIREAMESQELGGGIATAEDIARQAGPQADWTPLAERALADRTWTYGHIVVDEAQDLTPMAWNSLLRRCPSRSFTVVGDLDQARGHVRPDSWHAALGPASRGLEAEFVLTISYRTPMTVTSLAVDVLKEVGQEPLFPLTSARDVPDSLADTVVPLPLGRHDEKGDEDALRFATWKAAETESALLDDQLGAGKGTIGILVSDRRGEKWGADKLGDKALDQRVALLSVAGAKGLEFDTTIIVEPKEILADGPGDLFVAMTRCTRRLHSVRQGGLPKVWLETLTEVGALAPEGK